VHLNVALDDLVFGFNLGMRGFTEHPFEVFIRVKSIESFGELIYGERSSIFDFGVFIVII